MIREIFTHCHRRSPWSGRVAEFHRWTLAMKAAAQCVWLAVICVRLNAAVPSASEELQATMDGNAKFAFAIYKEISRAESGNLFISPWSISCVLVAAYAGAGGDTAREIRQAAFLPASPDALRRGFSFVGHRLQELDGQEGIALRRATAIWCHPSQKLRESFIEFCGAAVGARVLDQQFDRKAINDWVSEQTMGKIDMIIGPEELDDLSRLVLVNALYFKGRWQRQFAVEATRPGMFNRSLGAAVEVPMMRGEQTAPYAQYEGSQVLQLPYFGGQIVMLVVLPGEGTPLTSIETNLSTEWLKGCYRAFRPTLVDIKLPSFSLRSDLELNSTLQHLGMRKAFTLEADFSGIDGDPKNLLISAVLHQTYVDVNEEGTEAAAATGVHWRYGSSTSPVPFVCDRPFLFLIHAVKSGTVLFIGRVNDPSQPALTP
jgi:serpin B